MESKTVVFNGDVYIRHPNSKYYFKHTTRSKERKHAVQLHRAVWQFYNGEIPPNCHVHHKDGNVDNNDISNLECISAKSHLSMHALKNLKNESYAKKQLKNLEKAKECAKEWHSSEEGKEWHRQHAKESIRHSNPRKHDKQCVICGRDFVGTYYQVYCCQRCSNKARWKRTKEKR